MVGLIDIAPASRTVPVRGAEVDVYGVNVGGIANLLLRFPELRQLMSGREITVEQILGMSGEAVAAIISAGTGKVGDPDTESAASKLKLGEQIKLLSAIMKETMPNGLGPFMEEVREVMAELGLNVPEVEQVAEQATKSAKQSKS